jgi:hypothetical protein
MHTIEKLEKGLAKSAVCLDVQGSCAGWRSWMLSMYAPVICIAASTIALSTERRYLPKKCTSASAICQSNGVSYAFIWRATTSGHQRASDRLPSRRSGASQPNQMGRPNVKRRAISGGSGETAQYKRFYKTCAWDFVPCGRTRALRELPSLRWRWALAPTRQSSAL